MKKSRLSILVLSLLLASCATVPSAPAVVMCPKPPALVKEQLGLEFTPRMRDFLSGKVPGQTDYVLPLPRAIPNTKR